MCYPCYSNHLFRVRGHRTKTRQETYYWLYRPDLIRKKRQLIGRRSGSQVSSSRRGFVFHLFCLPGLSNLFPCCQPYQMLGVSTVAQHQIMTEEQLPTRDPRLSLENSTTLTHAKTWFLCIETSSRLPAGSGWRLQTNRLIIAWGAHFRLQRPHHTTPLADDEAAAEWRPDARESLECSCEARPAGLAGDQTGHHAEWYILWEDRILS